MQRISRNTAIIAAVSVGVLVISFPVVSWLFEAASERAEVAATLVPFLLAALASVGVAVVLHFTTEKEAERELYVGFGTSVSLLAFAALVCFLVPHLDLAPSNKTCAVLVIAALLGFAFAGFKESFARLRELTGDANFSPAKRRSI